MFTAVKLPAEKLKIISEKIRSGLAELTPPDFAAADDDILLAGCDVLDEAAAIYEKGDDMGYEVLYAYTLIIVFEACAKTCAGDYYVSSTI